MSELHRLAQAMCSVDLADSNWTQELPLLPVPDLWLTVSRYLSSLKAVLAPSGPSQPQRVCQLSADQLEAKRLQFERTSRLVEQFMLNEGPQLQRDLKEYANKCQNWATEYWLEDMYLSNPLPLPVNSNPFFMFPRQQFVDSQEMLMFATRIIQFSVDFKFRIDQQTLRQDFGSGHGRGKPLCMATYKNFFHSYRMPHEDTDRLLPQSRRSNHIVVASCNQFYILRLGQDPLEDPYRKEAGEQLNESIIFDQLLRIYRVSRETAKRELLADSSARRMPKVGLFTTENRKVWAKLHKRLSHCASPSSAANSNTSSGHCECPGNVNVDSLRQIEDCLFVMCLDSLVHPTPLGSLAGEQPASQGELDDEQVRAASVILTGAGSQLFTANRWFDKFLQIIVGRDGVCGINIEHSASEGITVTRFLEEFLAYVAANPFRSPTSAACPSSSSSPARTLTDPNSSSSSPARFTYGPQPAAPTGSSITSPGYVEPKSPSSLLGETDKITPLSWQLDEQLLLALNEAEIKVNKLINDFSLKILNFEHFGRSFIKSQNLSPDAFIQLALQLTFFKIHGHLVSTYESASLRQFRLGRVDNIRANTCEAHEWIQMMLACKQTAATSDLPVGARWKEAEGAFIRAITKQVEILRYTIIGGGPDNHLMALKRLAYIRYDDELPDLFTDRSYAEFLNFRLSTSQLPNESGITVGYGAVVPDGYGCSYNPCAERMVFCISSFHACTQTSSSQFAATLKETLLEMRELCLGRTG